MLISQAVFRLRLGISESLEQVLGPLYLRCGNALPDKGDNTWHCSCFAQIQIDID